MIGDLRYRRHKLSKGIYIDIGGWGKFRAQTHIEAKSIEMKNSNK